MWNSFKVQRLGIQNYSSIKESSLMRDYVCNNFLTISMLEANISNISQTFFQHRHILVLQRDVLTTDYIYKELNHFSTISSLVNEISTGECTCCSSSGYFIMCSTR